MQGKKKEKKKNQFKAHERKWREMGSTVNNRPGETLFTRMDGAAMVASDLMRWIKAALETEYGYT